MRSVWLPLALVLAAAASARADVGVTVDVDVALPPPPAPPPVTVVVDAPPPPTSIAVDAPPPSSPAGYREHTHPATLGLELTAVNGRVIGWGASLGTGVSAVIHPLDSYPLDVAIDYRRDVFMDDPDARVDHRINYTLYLGPQAPPLAWYVAIPMGVNIVTRSEMATVVEGFVGIGLGARWRVGDHFTVRADARIESRGQATNQDQDPDPTLPVHETAMSAQLSAGYYF